MLSWLFPKGCFWEKNLLGVVKEPHDLALGNTSDYYSHEHWGNIVLKYLTIYIIHYVMVMVAQGEH